MKKVAIILSMLILFVIKTQSDAVEINGIYYDLIEKGNVAEVTWNPNRYTGSIVIPESVVYEGKNYNVTYIGSYAFSSCNGMTSITIPKCVTSIGSSAFYNCI